MGNAWKWSIPLVHTAPRITLALLMQEDYRAALDLLLLAEESFQCCRDDLLKYIDNQGILLMDIVW